MKTNQGNIIFNPHPFNTMNGFYRIEHLIEFNLYRQKSTGMIVTVDTHKQVDLKFEGKPCIFTDDDYELFNNNYYENHGFYLPGGRRKPGTLGSAIKKIRKMEQVFPTGTVLKLVNKSYYKDDNTGQTASLDLEYKTTRKFQGYQETFSVSKQSYLSEIPDDNIVREFVKQMRENGFLVQVTDNEQYCDADHPDAYDSLAEYHMPSPSWMRPSFAAYFTGHGIEGGISYPGETLFGYTNGINNVLFDYKDEFNKWSRCYELKKPTNTEEVNRLVQELVTAKIEYDKTKQHG